MWHTVYARELALNSNCVLFVCGRESGRRWRKSTSNRSVMTESQRFVFMESHGSLVCVCNLRVECFCIHNLCLCLVWGYNFYACVCCVCVYDLDFILWQTVIMTNRPSWVSHYFFATYFQDVQFSKSKRRHNATLLNLHHKKSPLEVSGVSSGAQKPTILESRTCKKLMNEKFQRVRKSYFVCLRSIKS